MLRLGAALTCACIVWLIATLDVSAADDVILEAVVKKSAVAVGSANSIDVLVSNTGPGIATAVVVTNFLPAGVTLGNVSISQGSWSAAGNQLRLAFGGLGDARYALANIEFTCDVAGILWFTSVVARAEADADTSNNTAINSIAVGQPPPSTYGEFQWVTTFPGSNSSAAAIALDAQADSFVAGAFSGVVSFGANQLTSAGDLDLFVAKLDHAGEVIWAVRAGGPGADVGVGIVVTPDGTAFVTGSFVGTAAFGTLSLTNTNSTAQGFLARLDSTGQFQWVRALTNCGAAFVALAPASPRIWLACPGLPLLRSYDFDGANIANFNVSSNAGVAGLAVDSLGGVYLNGTFVSAADFGGIHLTGPGNGALYTAKVAPDGTVLWAITANDSHRQEGHGVVLSPDGSVISYGRIDVSHLADVDPSILLMKHSADGALLWTNYYGFTRTPLSADALAVDREGNPHLVGHKMDPYTNPDPRWGTPIIAATATGAIAHASRITGAHFGEDSHGLGLALDAEANLYIAGYFNGTALFGTNAITASPIGATDAYVAKFNPVMHPPLRSTRTTNGIALAWPSTAVGFRLQGTEQLPAPGWSNVAGIPMTNAAGFYRLMAP